MFKQLNKLVSTDLITHLRVNLSKNGQKIKTLEKKNFDRQAMLFEIR